jgi:hypothetical protein
MAKKKNLVSISLRNSVKSDFFFCCLKGRIKHKFTRVPLSERWLRLPGLSQRHTDRHVRPSVTSDKILVHQIRVNTMMTSDKIKLELLCPRRLPRHYHVGWLDVSFHYIARAAEHIALWRAQTAAIWAHTASEWDVHG